MATEETRPAGPGETGTTRFGMEQGDNTDVASPPLGETPAPRSKDEPVGAGGGTAATGLQPGGMTPGGGPGATVGSIGTGGGSNRNQATGDADENTIEEDVR